MKHEISTMIDRRKASAETLVICAVLAFLVFWIYSPVARFEFLEVFDDHYYLTDNVHVPKGVTVDGVKWAFTSVYKPYWQPLAIMSHMVDVELFGMKSGAHHLVNVLIHLANAILLFFVLKAMTGALWESAMVAALFSVHPLHVESVAWIAERKDVLSATFGKKAKAAEHFRSALALRPGYVEALNNLALISAELGNNEEAVTLFRRALERSPGKAAIHNNLGVSLMRLGRWGEARRSFLRALEIDPRNVQAIANLDLLGRTPGMP